jgi:hypothetical protein
VIAWLVHLTCSDNMPSISIGVQAARPAMQLDAVTRATIAAAPELAEAAASAAAAILHGADGFAHKPDDVTAAVLQAVQTAQRQMLAKADANTVIRSAAQATTVANAAAQAAVNGAVDGAVTRLQEPSPTKECLYACAYRKAVVKALEAAMHTPAPLSGPQEPAPDQDSFLLGIRKLVPIEILQVWYFVRSSIIDGDVGTAERNIMFIFWAIFVILVVVYTGAHMFLDPNVRRPSSQDRIRWLAMLLQSSLAAFAFFVVTIIDGEPFLSINKGVRMGICGVATVIVLIARLFL